MKAKLLGDAAGRAYAIVFDMGDEVLDELARFVEAEAFNGARLYGIGGFSHATLAYYDMQAKQYLPIEVDEQVEVVSFIGNVAIYQGKPRIHVHCIVGHRDGRTTGGHLLAGIVSPTLELMVDEISVGLHRTERPEIGIPLLDF